MELIRLALAACFGAESGEETCCLCEVIRINSGYLGHDGFSSSLLDVVYMTLSTKCKSVKAEALC